MQFSVDVAFLDYYILNTATDLDQGSTWGLNVFVGAGVFMFAFLKARCTFRLCVLSH